MATLDNWKFLLETEHIIYLHEMAFIIDDNGPSPVKGSGEIRIFSDQIVLVLSGETENHRELLKIINQQNANPYDLTGRFRFIGTDNHGHNWNGWVTDYYPGHQDGKFHFFGNTSAIFTTDSSASVPKTESIELQYKIPHGHPISRVMPLYSENHSPSHTYRYGIAIMSSSIEFLYDASERILTIKAQHSEKLKAPYLENWLGEALTIMLGQLVYPRIVARNNGKGQAQISLRDTPEYIEGAKWAALWHTDGKKEDFWTLYAQILSLIADAKDKDGELNFELNKITALYEEVIQASRGSRWIWALTFASSIEGLIKIIEPSGSARPDANIQAINLLAEHIKKWKGPDDLKQAAQDAVYKKKSTYTIYTMRELEKNGVVTNEQITAWRKIRNAVMHGDLISPYSNEEDDNNLLHLASMMHSLTREIIKRNTERTVEI